MRIARLGTRIGVVLAATLLLSCSEGSPTQPTAATLAPASDAELLGLLTPTIQRVGLLTCRPMPTATATATIGPDGGRLAVGPHTLVVPRGALRRPVTITATAPSGRVNRVEFEPHGLSFETSARLTMSYANCDLLGSLLPKRIAYVDSGLSILYYLVSVDDLLNRRVTGRLEHFSEYAVSW